SRRAAWERQQNDKVGRIQSEIEYLVWSEQLICPRCDREVSFGAAAYDPIRGKVAERFACPHCATRMDKRHCARRMEEVDDPLLKTQVRRPKLLPFFTAYRVEGRPYYRRALLDDAGPNVPLKASLLPQARPVLRGERFYKDALQEGYGVTHVHHFYTARNLHLLGRMLAAARSAPPPVARL